MLEPKPIAKEAVPAALDKALRYRLLNEPVEAESICRDILDVDPGNQSALVTLLLALTDQFEHDFTVAFDAAKQVLPRLSGAYERAYYEGIIHERWGKAQLARGLPVETAIGWFRSALGYFEQAQRLSAPKDPDAVLRWNACVRVLERYSRDAPYAETLTDDIEAGFSDDVPAR